MKNIFKLIIVLSPLPLAGCSEGLRDWAQGAWHINCDYSDYVSSEVVNSTVQDLKIGYCSDKYAIRPEPKLVTAHTEYYESLTQNVNKKSDRIETKMGDSCRDAGFSKTGNKMGETFPLLSDNDLKSYQICNNPKYQLHHADGTITEIQVYQIVDRAQGCPAGATPFDQDKAGCI